eukprot:Gb_26213 [translate_table: standard]
MSPFNEFEEMKTTTRTGVFARQIFCRSTLCNVFLSNHLLNNIFVSNNTNLLLIAHSSSTQSSRFIASSTSHIASSPPNIEEFLQKSCGLSPKQAILASKPLLHLKSLQNPDQVLQLFKEHGFGDAHIQNLVIRRPKLLSANVQKILEPKVRILESIGIVGKQLGFLFSRDPSLLGTSLNKKILLGICFLQNLLQSNDNVARVVIREPWILHSDLEKKFKPNFLYLQSNGVDRKLISNFFVAKPRILVSTETLIKNVVETVDNLGVPRHSKMFPRAIFILSSMNKVTLERKLKFYISLGLSEEELLLAFRKSPNIVSVSEKNIQNHMDFLVNTLKYQPSAIVLYPRFVTSSMEARIIPRYRVFQILKSMQLLKEDFSLLNMFCISEKRFLERFINKYGESSGLYATYKGTDGTLSSLERR